MKRNIHRWVVPRLDAYIDRELEFGDSARVARHLDECWLCSGDIQARIGIRASLRGLGRSRPVELAQVRLRTWTEEQML